MDDNCYDKISLLVDEDGSNIDWAGLAALLSEEIIDRDQDKVLKKSPLKERDRLEQKETNSRIEFENSNIELKSSEKFNSEAEQARQDHSDNKSISIPGQQLKAFSAPAESPKEQEAALANSLTTDTHYKMVCKNSQQMKQSKLREPSSATPLDAGNGTCPDDALSQKECSRRTKRRKQYHPTRPNKVVVEKSHPVYNDWAKRPTPRLSIKRRRSRKNTFPSVLYRILENAQAEGYSKVCRWEVHGRAFIIYKQKLFEQQVMPKYFGGKGANHYDSFRRKLNLYGFLRINGLYRDDQGAYYHERFLRGRPDLCRHIDRVKVRGTGARTTLTHESEPKFNLFPPMPQTESVFLQPESEGQPGDEVQALKKNEDSQQPEGDFNEHARTLTKDPEPTAGDSLALSSALLYGNDGPYSYAETIQPPPRAPPQVQFHVTTTSHHAPAMGAGLPSNMSRYPIPSQQSLGRTNSGGLMKADERLEAGGPDGHHHKSGCLHHMPPPPPRRVSDSLGSRGAADRPLGQDASRAVISPQVPPSWPWLAAPMTSTFPPHWMPPPSTSHVYSAGDHLIHHQQPPYHHPPLYGVAHPGHPDLLASGGASLAGSHLDSGPGFSPPESRLPSSPAMSSSHVVETGYRRDEAKQTGEEAEEDDWEPLAWIPGRPPHDQEVWDLSSWAEFLQPMRIFLHDEGGDADPELWPG